MTTLNTFPTLKPNATLDDVISLVNQLARTRQQDTGLFNQVQNQLTPNSASKASPVFSGSATLQDTINGNLTFLVNNKSTGASAVSQIELETGTANSTAIFALSDNAGSPSLALTLGSAVSTFTLPNGTNVTTQSVGNRSTRAASTTFANPASSLSGNGYVQFPSGAYLQWGVTGSIGGGSSSSVSFPISFPSNCFTVIVCSTSSPGGTQGAVSAISITTSGFTAFNGLSNAQSLNWMAVGN